MFQKEVSNSPIENLYDDQLASINAVRSKQINAIFIVSATFGLPPLLASIFRSIHFGFQPVMYVQLCTYLLVLFMVAVRNRLSYKTRVYTLLTVLFILGVGGLYTWGLLGMGIPFLISCCVITTVLHGSRAGIITTVLCVLVVASIGFLVITGKRVFPFDIGIYAITYPSWVLAICSTALFTSIIVITSGKLHNSLMDSILALSKHTATLQTTNEELQKEIAKREEIEAELRKYEGQLEKMVDQRTQELQLALANVKVLAGMLPICASCKNIRDDEGYWHRVEEYIRDHSEAEFSHGICPICIRKLYPDLYNEAVS
jgi:hypothetical protein